MSKPNKLAGALAGLKAPTETKAAQSSETKATAASGAKSKNPDYIGTTVYLRRATLADAKRAILLDETKQHSDVSELIEHLLAEWLNAQSSKA